jgi:hypothetical protein
MTAISSRDSNAAWPHSLKRFYGSTAREALREEGGQP